MLECIFNLYFRKMGVSGFWEFASKTVVKSPRSPSLGQACHGLGFRPPLPVVWAGVWPLRGPSWQPCPVGEGASGPGQEVRQSSNLETQRQRGRGLKGAGGGERASGGLGWTDGASRLKKPVQSRGSCDSPHTRWSAQELHRISRSHLDPGLLGARLAPGPETEILPSGRVSSRGN